jgi:hypothetical protein
MNHMKLAVLTATTGLICCFPLQAEVIHRQFGSDNLFVRVSAESWQPENFVNGTPVPSTYLKLVNIALDGKIDEPDWIRAAGVLIPLEYGSVKEAFVKSLYTDTDVYISVSWADSTENRQHHPWVWSPEQQEYISSQQVEDSVLLSFEKGCEWTPSLLSGYSFDFDGWQWLAARSDPVGQAWDLTGSLDDRSRANWPHDFYESRNTGDAWNLKFNDYSGQLISYNWYELDRSYNYRTVRPTTYYRTEPDRMGIRDASIQLPKPQAAPVDESSTYPQFQAVKLEGDAGEVSAKGHWEDGYWTVEFRRSLETHSKFSHDTLFNRLTQFSIHIFDQTERIDQSSESARLFLRFLPQDLVLVKE